MIFDVYVTNADNLDDVCDPASDSLCFDCLTAKEAEDLCRLARNQGYTVVSFLRIEEE